MRVIHTADWQIGKPFGTVADEQKRFRLQQERMAAIGRIRDVVRVHDAQLVVVAGDLFDSPTPDSTAVLEVLELIGEMAVPVLVIPGNHDHGAPGTVWHRDDFQRHQRQQAPNLQLLLVRQPLVLPTVVVLPCPLLRNQDSTDPTHWLRALDWSALPNDRPRLVLAHGGVHGFGGRDYEGDDEAQAGANNLIDLTALPAGQIDYVALGDWHNLKQVSDQAWYPGTPEPDRFDQGDGNQRGQVLLVDLHRGQTPEVKPLSTGRIQWHNLKLHLRVAAVEKTMAFLRAQGIKPEEMETGAVKSEKQENRDSRSGELRSTSDVDRVATVANHIGAITNADTSSIDKDITAVMSKPHQRPSSLHS